MYTGQGLGNYNGAILQSLDAVTWKAIRSTGGLVEGFVYLTPMPAQSHRLRDRRSRRRRHHGHPQYPLRADLQQHVLEQSALGSGQDIPHRVRGYLPSNRVQGTNQPAQRRIRFPYPVGLAALLRLDQPLGVGLLLLGTAAGAPFLPKLAQIAKGNLAFGVGLMVLLMVVTVGYLPLVLPLLLPGVSVNPAQIARSLFLLMLLPLAGALVVRARFAPAAARTKPVLDRVSNLSLILLIVLITVTNINNVLAVFGTRGILAALLFLAVGFGVGWLLGGPGTDTRRVLALGTAQRNIAAALVVGGQSFTDPKVVVMIIVVAIVGLLVLMPLSKALGRDSPARLAGSVGGSRRLIRRRFMCAGVWGQRHPSMNTVNEKKKGLKQTILHELIRYWLIVLYMTIFFGAFASYRRLLLAHYGISYEDYGIAVIRALVLGKVVLVAETLRLGRGYEESL